MSADDEANLQYRNYTAGCEVPGRSYKDPVGHTDLCQCLGPALWSPERLAMLGTPATSWVIRFVRLRRCSFSRILRL